MDLNEKIEARRRERILEAREAEKLTKERERIEREIANKIKESENLEIRREAMRRLESMGIEPVADTKPDSNETTGEPPTAQPALVTNSQLDEAKIDSEVQKELNKAVANRMTTGESSTIGILFLLGIVMLFISWPIGIALFVAAILYSSEITQRHKKELISEGEKNIQNTPVIDALAQQENTCSNNIISPPPQA